MPDNLENLDNPLASNKSFAAHARDSERSAAQGPGPVDLRIIDCSAWDIFENQQLIIPEGVRSFLRGHDGTPLPPETVQSLEEAVEKFHGITPPWSVTMEIHTQQTGRAAMFPEHGYEPTGFVLDRIEEP